MTYARHTPSSAAATLPQMPAWVTSARPETPEDVAFLSGAALAHLHLVVHQDDVPQTLLRARLALRAAETCVTHQGRPERAAELRDALGFLRPGDAPGPAGAVYLAWRRATERRCAAQALHRALPEIDAGHIAHYLGAGQGAPVNLLIEDLSAELTGRPYEVAPVAGGWMLRTRPAYAAVIRAAADVGAQDLNLREFDLAVLAAIAYHQPITREGLRDIFGKEISRDLIGRLHDRALIGPGPRAPRRGAPYTYVTTDQFLAAFGLETLHDLPDREQLRDAGLHEGT